MLCASRLSVGVVVLLFLASGRAERETCIAMNLIPVVFFLLLTPLVSSFLSLKCWDGWELCLCGCAVPVSLFCCVLFVFGFYRLMDAFVIAIVFNVAHNDTQHCSLLYFINHVPNSIRSFIDITITNSAHSEQWTANMHQVFPEWKLSLIVLSKNVVGFVSSGAVYGEKSTCERARANPI